MIYDRIPTTMDYNCSLGQEWRSQPKDLTETLGTVAN